MIGQIAGWCLVSVRYSANRSPSTFTTTPFPFALGRYLRRSRGTARKCQQLDDRRQHATPLICLHIPPRRTVVIDGTPKLLLLSLARITSRIH